MSNMFNTVIKAINIIHFLVKILSNMSRVKYYPFGTITEIFKL